MCVCLFCWASCFRDVHIFGKVRHGLRATTKRHAVMSSRGARGERVYSQTHARMNAWMYAQKYTCTYVWRCWWKPHFYKCVPWSKECSSQKKVELWVLNCDLRWRALLQAHTPLYNHLSYSLHWRTSMTCVTEECLGPDRKQNQEYENVSSEILGKKQQRMR